MRTRRALQILELRAQGVVGSLLHGHARILRTINNNNNKLMMDGPPVSPVKSNKFKKKKKKKKTTYLEFPDFGLLNLCERPNTTHFDAILLTLRLCGGNPPSQAAELVGCKVRVVAGPRTFALLGRVKLRLKVRDTLVESLPRNWHCTDDAFQSLNGTPQRETSGI
jgi:hypothetical protein